MARSRSLFERMGGQDRPHARGVNARAGERLERGLVTPGPGTTHLLLAPRAGYGKTHLLEQCRQQLGGSHRFVALATFARPDWISISVQEHLAVLDRPLPAAAGLTALDLLARRILATGLEPLVARGHVPCADRATAATTLRQRPTEILDFHHPQAPIATWFRQHFPSLKEPLAAELHATSAGPVEATLAWVEELSGYAFKSPTEGSRLTGTSPPRDAEAAAARFEAMLSLWQRLGPVVVVIDEFEELHPEPASLDAALARLEAWRRRWSELQWVISVNEDVWERGFGSRLSSATCDRWSESVIRLEPLTEREIRALLACHGCADPSAVRAALALPPAERYARRVLQRAAEFAAPGP